MQFSDSPENRFFLKSWFAILILEEGVCIVLSEITETINGCVDYTFEQLAPEFRTLSRISQFLPIDLPR